MLPNLTAVAFSIMSLHLPNDGQNQLNPGVHLEITNARMGYYRNSRDRNTAYVGYAVPFYGSKNFRVSGMVALCSGYRSPVCGGLELVVSEHLAVMVVPGVGQTATTLGFAFRIPL